MEDTATVSQTSSLGFNYNRGPFVQKTKITPLLAPTILPNIDHIITEDDTPVDNLPSSKQQRLLVETLYNTGLDHQKNRKFLADANIGLFFEPDEPPLVPDMFLSLDISVAKNWWKKENRSYFTWVFGKVPEVVIEIVSNKEGNEDGSKLRDYAQIGIPHYLIFDPQKQLSEEILRIYKLTRGKYVQQSTTWLSKAGIGITLWNGIYEDQQDIWLRWCHRNGDLLLTGTESTQKAEQQAKQADELAKQERQRAQKAEKRAKKADERAKQEHQRAEQERQRAEQLAAKLRELGIDPDLM